VSAAEGAAEAVDTAGFWVGFTLVFVISAVESAASVIWTRFRVTSDGIHPIELSCRVCGREIFLSIIDEDAATEIANEGMPAGCYSGSDSSVTASNMHSTMTRSRSDGCSCCGGFESRHTETHGRVVEAVIDKFFSFMMAPTLLIRRFNPATGLSAPAGLVSNVKGLLKPDIKRTVGRMLEHGVHLFVGLVDISLGVAGLALKPESPQNLYDTLKDPSAPMTFENYLTLFLLYWLLGAVLLLCMIPLHSSRRSTQVFGWPGVILFLVAALASLVLFGLGCWKIDYARRHRAAWTPMLSYWIGGASGISFPLFGIEVFHVFGVVGLILMVKHTFS